MAFTAVLVSLCFYALPAFLPSILATRRYIHGSGNQVTAGYACLNNKVRQGTSSSIRFLVAAVGVFTLPPRVHIAASPPPSDCPSSAPIRPPTGPCPQLPCTFGAWALDLEDQISRQCLDEIQILLRFRVQLSEYYNFGRIEPGRQGLLFWSRKWPSEAILPHGATPPQLPVPR